MKRKLKMREREVLGVALREYEALATTTKKNLEALNLPNSKIHVDTAIGNIGIIRERLGTTGEEVEVQEDLRITVHDCLTLMFDKTEKLKNTQLKMTMGTSDAEDYEELVQGLQRAFAEQMALL